MSKWNGSHSADSILMPYIKEMYMYHDDVIKWKHFPRYWPFVQGIHRSPVISPHKGQWHGALMISFICTWINGSVNNRGAGDLRRHHAHCDVNVIITWTISLKVCSHLQALQTIPVLISYQVNQCEDFLSIFETDEIWILQCHSLLLPYQLFALCYY